MNSTDDKVLNLFLQKIRAELGDQLKQVILFGSRARGDFTEESDYDCLVLVDRVSAAVEEAINELSGELLYEYNEVFSIFPVQEEKFQQDVYEPLYMNVRREGLIL
jgi:predicted nucleotidyltransferase